MPIEVIIMMIGMGLGAISIRLWKSLAKKKEGEQKAKEDAGLFIKPQIS